MWLCPCSHVPPLDPQSLFEVGCICMYRQRVNLPVLMDINRRGCFRWRKKNDEAARVAAKHSVQAPPIFCCSRMPFNRSHCTMIYFVFKIKLPGWISFDYYSWWLLNPDKKWIHSFKKSRFSTETPTLKYWSNAWWKE